MKIYHLATLYGTNTAALTVVHTNELTELGKSEFSFRRLFYYDRLRFRIHFGFHFS
jgi:hypothetical protein